MFFDNLMGEMLFKFKQFTLIEIPVIKGCVKRGLTGIKIPISSSGERCSAFIPNDLPPNPPIEVDERLQNLLASACLSLGRLDGLTRMLPDAAILIYSFVRKEAVLSSQIEGTQSSFSDLLLFENEGIPGAPLEDAQEASNYVAAMNKGLELLGQAYPICVRMIRSVHAELLARGRGKEKEPGEFRRSQNWIGGTRPGNAVFVPPPADQVIECLAKLEEFINFNFPSRMPAVITAGLAHVQFETIHPFLDGNGRVGRMLVPLILCYTGILKKPTIFLSLFLKQNRALYYDLLQRVRMEGEWESWLEFFLEGVDISAREACKTSSLLLELAREDRRRIEKIGRGSGTALRVHDLLQKRPIISIGHAVKELEVSFPTVSGAMDRLVELNVVKEFTGGARGRLFGYEKWVKVLNEGTERSESEDV